MRLIENVVKKRLELYDELTLKHQYVRAVWHFYQAYNICLNLLGMKDDSIKIKNRMIARLMVNFHFSLYSKILDFIRKDTEVISLAFDFIELNKGDGGEYSEEYYQRGMFAVNVYD
jgi:hypothetical protein